MLKSSNPKSEIRNLLQECPEIRDIRSSWNSGELSPFSLQHVMHSFSRAEITKSVGRSVGGIFTVFWWQARHEGQVHGLRRSLRKQFIVPYHINLIQASVPTKLKNISEERLLWEEKSSHLALLWSSGDGDYKWAQFHCWN